jgi:hypothetical protein
MSWTKSLFKDFADRALMVVLALGICVFGVASFWIADDYHINVIWVFASWNSVILLPLFLRMYGGQTKKRGFILFLVAWMVIHGLFMTLVMRWVPLACWLIPIALELAAGAMVARWISAFSLPTPMLTRGGRRERTIARNKVENDFLVEP